MKRMSKHGVLKGVFLVSLGASFYGMLATVVKISYNEGYTISETIVSQYLFGLIGLAILVAVQSKISKKSLAVPQKKDYKNLILLGTTYGLTSVFYYISVHYLDVSIAIVLLMQSVWISVALESLLEKKLPERRKIIAALIVLIGTVFATNAINTEAELNWKGIFFGLLAATAFSGIMYTSNRVSNQLPVLRKSLLMLIGGGLVVFSFAFLTQIGPFYLGGIFEKTQIPFVQVGEFNFSVLWKYGIFLSVFGTILPPIMLNSGFPKTGLGLGSIVSSLELPVSVCMAYIFLSEEVLLIQWSGIALILGAIVYMNVGKSKSL